MPRLNLIDARADGQFLDLLVRVGDNRTLMAMRTQMYDSNIVPQFDPRTGKSSLTGSIVLDIQQLEKIPAEWIEQMQDGVKMLTQAPRALPKPEDS